MRIIFLYLSLLFSFHIWASSEEISPISSLSDPSLPTIIMASSAKHGNRIECLSAGNSGDTTGTTLIPTVYPSTSCISEDERTEENFDEFSEDEKEDHRTQLKRLSKVSFAQGLKINDQNVKFIEKKISISPCVGGVSCYSSADASSAMIERISHRLNKEEEKKTSEIRPRRSKGSLIQKHGQCVPLAVNLEEKALESTPFYMTPRYKAPLQEKMMEKGFGGVYVFKVGYFGRIYSDITIPPEHTLLDICTNNKNKIKKFNIYFDPNNDKYIKNMPKEDIIKKFSYAYNIDKVLIKKDFYSRIIKINKIYFKCLSLIFKDFTIAEKDHISLSMPTVIAGDFNHKYIPSPRLWKKGGSALEMRSSLPFSPRPSKKSLSEPQDLLQRKGNKLIVLPSTPRSNLFSPRPSLIQKVQEFSFTPAGLSDKATSSPNSTSLELKYVVEATLQMNQKNISTSEPEVPPPVPLVSKKELLQFFNPIFCNKFNKKIEEMITESLKIKEECNKLIQEIKTPFNKNILNNVQKNKNDILMGERINIINEDIELNTEKYNDLKNKIFILSNIIIYSFNDIINPKNNVYLDSILKDPNYPLFKMSYLEYAHTSFRSCLNEILEHEVSDKENKNKILDLYNHAMQENKEYQKAFAAVKAGFLGVMTTFEEINLLNPPILKSKSYIKKVIPIKINKGNEKEIKQRIEAEKALPSILYGNLMHVTEEFKESLIVYVAFNDTLKSTYLK